MAHNPAANRRRQTLSEQIAEADPEWFEESDHIAYKFSGKAVVKEPLDNPYGHTPSAHNDSK